MAVAAHESEEGGTDDKRAGYAGDACGEEPMAAAGCISVEGIVEISVELLDMHGLAGAIRDYRQITGVFATSRDQSRIPYSCRSLMPAG